MKIGSALLLLFPAGTIAARHGGAYVQGEEMTAEKRLRGGSPQEDADQHEERELAGYGYPQPPPRPPMMGYGPPPPMAGYGPPPPVTYGGGGGGYGPSHSKKSGGSHSKKGGGGGYAPPPSHSKKGGGYGTHSKKTGGSHSKKVGYAPAPAPRVYAPVPPPPVPVYVPPPPPVHPMPEDCDEGYGHSKKGGDMGYGHSKKGGGYGYGHSKKGGDMGYGHSKKGGGYGNSHSKKSDGYGYSHSKKGGDTGYGHSKKGGYDGDEGKKGKKSGGGYGHSKKGGYAVPDCAPAPAPYYPEPYYPEPYVTHPPVKDPTPEVTIKVFIDKKDGDTTPITLPPGERACSYKVMNTGPVAVSLTSVTDNQGNQIYCPKNMLKPGEYTICTSKCTPSLHKSEITGFVKAVTKGYSKKTTEAEDNTRYVVMDYRISIDVLINGLEKAVVGSGIENECTYIVTNSCKGHKKCFPLKMVELKDDDGNTIDCGSQTTLAVGASVTCTSKCTFDEGDSLTGKVSAVTTGYGYGMPVASTDVAFYRFEGPQVCILAEVSVDNGVNWLDANDAPGPNITFDASDALNRVIVTNCGDVDLAGLDVPLLETITCNETGGISASLEVGARDVCTWTIDTSTDGQVSVVYEVTGMSTLTNVGVSATDPLNYNVVPEELEETAVPQSTTTIELIVYSCPGPVDAGCEDVDPLEVELYGTVYWMYWVYISASIDPQDLVWDVESMYGEVTCDDEQDDAGYVTCWSESEAAQAGTFENKATVSWNNLWSTDNAWCTTNEQSGTQTLSILALEIKTYISDSDVYGNGNMDDDMWVFTSMESDAYWYYNVTNTGNVVATSVEVTSDLGLTVTCPQKNGQITLQPGSSIVCSAAGGKAIDYAAELGTVYSDGAWYDEDPAACRGPARFTITIIDEANNYEDWEYKAFWDTFRANWPTRWVCALKPLPAGGDEDFIGIDGNKWALGDSGYGDDIDYFTAVEVQKGWVTSTTAVGVNYLDTCNYQNIGPGFIVAIFVDNSGSMSPGSVGKSLCETEKAIGDAGGTICYTEASDPDEDYIRPNDHPFVDFTHCVRTVAPGESDCNDFNPPPQ